MGEIVTPSGGIDAADVAASEKGRGSVRQSSRAVTIVGVVIGIAVVAGWLALRNRDHAATPSLPEKAAASARR